jgi:hypothetical protein
MIEKIEYGFSPKVLKLNSDFFNFGPTSSDFVLVIVLIKNNNTNKKIIPSNILTILNGVFVPPLLLLLKNIPKMKYIIKYIAKNQNKSTTPDCEKTCVIGPNVDTGIVGIDGNVEFVDIYITTSYFFL